MKTEQRAIPAHAKPPFAKPSRKTGMLRSPLKSTSARIVRRGPGAAEPACRMKCFHILPVLRAHGNENGPAILAGTVFITCRA